MKPTYNKARPKFRFVAYINNLSKYSMLILHIALPMICAAFVAILYVLSRDAQICAAAALDKFPLMLEYISRALVLTVIGAFALDIADKKRGKN